MLELCSTLVYDKGNEGWGRIPKTGIRLIEERNKKNLGASRTFACLTVITTRGVSLSILGKDEVASSNLASSSKPLKLFEFQGLFFTLGNEPDRILFHIFSWKDAVWKCVQKSAFLNSGTMWAPFPTKRWIFVFPSFYEPFSWIVFDILPYFVVILLVADHMIVISGLPDVLAVFLVAKPFECSHKSCNHGCPGRRDTPPGVFDLFVDWNQKMNMIRHDHIFIHRQMVIKCIYLPDVFVSDFSIGQ